MTTGHLNDKEPHPAAHAARAFIANIPVSRMTVYFEALSSCAIEDNRLGEVCAETLSLLFAGKTVNDRYVLGLAWTLRTMEDNRREQSGD